MTIKTFTKDELDKALKGLMDSYNIFVPVKEGDFHNFRPLQADTRPNFNMENSRLSPKSIVYPQSERMFEYSVDQGKEDSNIIKETQKDFPPQVIVGIRPCDRHAFDIVKRNFDNSEYQDPWWVQRFESTIFFGLGCNEPCPTCFCTSVGGGPFSEKGLDGLIYRVDDKFIIKGLTQKGDEFLDKTETGSATGEPEIKEAEKIAASALDKIKTKVPTDKLKDKVTNELFEAEIWEDVSFACINCGTCTFLCPTCWCFDIQDELLGTDGDRIRNWDSCMFPLFTLEGSGHNPRNDKFQRVRQRFMHKLKYYVDKYENGVQCSGCGRCVRYCPVNIDIRKVAELMNNS